MDEYPEFSHQLQIHAAPAYGPLFSFVGKGCSRHIYLLVANELAGKHPQTSRKSVTELAFLCILKETVLFSHGFKRRHGKNWWEKERHRSRWHNQRDFKDVLHPPLRMSTLTAETLPFGTGNTETLQEAQQGKQRVYYFLNHCCLLFEIKACMKLHIRFSSPWNSNYIAYVIKITFL